MKTDEQGRFEIKDIPTTVPFQFEIRKPTKELLPPTEDTRASGLMKFEHPGENDRIFTSGESRLTLMVDLPDGPRPEIHKIWQLFVKAPLKTGEMFDGGHPWLANDDTLEFRHHSPQWHD